MAESVKVSCGFVGSVENEPDDEGVEVFTDQVCTKCGHPPCPFCGNWCDKFVQADGSEPDEDDSHEGLEPCCDTECVYAAEPKFFKSDGSLWNGELSEAEVVACETR